MPISFKAWSIASGKEAGERQEVEDDAGDKAGEKVGESSKEGAGEKGRKYIQMIGTDLCNQAFPATTSSSSATPHSTVVSPIHNQRRNQ